MTKIIGILNVTPDSFFDGGKHFTYEAAINKAQALIKDGVDIIDIGAESTRPGAELIDEKEELARLKDIFPKIIKICNDAGVKTCIDSHRASVIKFALQNRVDVINDQKALDAKEKLDLAKKSQKPIIFMHSLGLPANREIDLPEDVDIIDQLKLWATKKIAELENFGIKKQNLIFDPGLGFGKTFDQCYQIIKRVEELQTLGICICIGHSNKGFLKNLGNSSAFTLAVSALLLHCGIDFLRVHDVKSHCLLKNKFY